MRILSKTCSEDCPGSSVPSTSSSRSCSWLRGCSGVVIQPGRRGRTYIWPILQYHGAWPQLSCSVAISERDDRGCEHPPRDRVSHRPARRQGERLDEALMLTRDENIVQVELLIQYRVGNSREFVFNTRNPEDILVTSAEVACAAQSDRCRSIPRLPRSVQRCRMMRVFLSRLLGDYGTGILVTDVRLQVAIHPLECAMPSGGGALSGQGATYQRSPDLPNDVVPRCGEKQRLIEEATGFKGSCCAACDR